MFLKKITLYNFKSYEELDIDFKYGLTIFIGLNGSGKTNLLDAIYFSCLTKSISGLTDAQLIKNEESIFVVKCVIDEDEVNASLKKGGKKSFLVNKSPYPKISEHIGKYPLVFVSPNDHDVIRDSSELRRKFFDSILCQVDHEYLTALLKYNNILKQRNKTLKQFKERHTFDQELLNAYTEQLIPLNAKIKLDREKLAIEMITFLGEFYEEIAQNKEAVTLNYESNVEVESLGDSFLESQEKDKILCRTSVGIHKDDYAFTINDLPIKKYGSQGQQKSFMLALQLAKFKYLENKTGKQPLLLLDDIFDKLDESRISMIIEMINNGLFGQVFITDASKKRTLRLMTEMKEDVTIFEIQDAKATEIEQ